MFAPARTSSRRRFTTDTTEDEKMRFFKEVVDKSIRDAISSHNEAFVDIFHNGMREAIHGFPVGVDAGPIGYPAREKEDPV